MVASSKDKIVVLATAVVTIKSKCGTYKLARALLDSGSQLNLITEDLASKLKLQREGSGINLLGIGDCNVNVKQKVNAVVKSRVTEYEFNSDFWIIKSISAHQPDRYISTDSWNIPQNVQLADPDLFKREKIDLLIGADIFFELLSVGQIKIHPSLPTLQKTLLGWVVSGSYKPNNEPVKYSCSLLAETNEEGILSLDSVVRKFWEIEELPNKPCKWAKEQELCERHFVETMKRLPSGRFEVGLPFKASPDTLGNSFDAANRRYLALERRLAKNPENQRMYYDFMHEYLELGHMSPIRGNSIPAEAHYFILQQVVVTPKSTTTKLRVVFDASCKTSSSASLNDILMVGPTIQSQLYIILLRFRCHKYAITADITKMYRQILIREEDRQFLLILFRPDPKRPIQIMRLNTVTYGSSPAPYLATRCLKKLSDLNKKQYSLGAKVIAEDAYIDDFLTGGDTIQEVEQIRNELTTILESAGFPLAKWHSNINDALSSEEKGFQVTDTEFTRTLGIIWYPKEDTFHFKFDNDFKSLKATKRNILSVSARLFDPLGLLCPVVVKAKILLQELWLLKLDWDESIPMHLQTAWQDFKNSLSNVSNISIPRFVNTSASHKIEIHGFADASMRAYGCCIYVRCTTDTDTICRLLTAKSKVSRLKTVSLPRLELLAAHLLVKLWQSIKQYFNPHVENVIFWTDSEIVLHWIKTHPASLATFVANRVAEIQELSQNIRWRHVPTKSNPADIVSRGCNANEFSNSIWFEGPAFLKFSPENWPVNSIIELSEELKTLERRNAKTILTVAEQASDPIIDITEKYSSYTKILRIVGCIYRFLKPFNKPRTLTQLTAKELDWVFLKIIEVLQKHEFAEELKLLQSGKLLKSNIQKLNPFIHEYVDTPRKCALIRVGGRLLNATLPFDTKFPLLLSKNAMFVMVYVMDLHVRNYHCCATVLISLMRQKIWVINAKYRPKLIAQIIGNLPIDRLRSIRPFLVCGVDFCGPVYTSYRIRGKPPYKTYLAVFVCFSSKAVHIDVVSDLTSDAFLLVLKRFIGRRGVPKKILCDNATNFVGANSALKELRNKFLSEDSQRVIRNYTAERGVEFAFIPPRPPHFGGLWEAALKSTKTLLMRTIANAKLTYEELTTCLVDIEAILNSRPIVPQSTDPNDGEALTPGHLLLGGPLIDLPVQCSSIKITYYRRFQMVCALKEQFWCMFQRDYITTLQNREKWCTRTDNIKLGTMVLVHEDNLPPQRWLLGRIVATIPGRDGVIRVADVVTKNGSVRRAVHKLAPLPIS